METVLDEIIPYVPEERSNGQVTYVCRITPQTAGSYYIASRVYAYNSKLPHRQDFALVKWL